MNRHNPVPEMDMGTRKLLNAARKARNLGPYRMAQEPYRLPVTPNKRKPQTMTERQKMLLHYETHSAEETAEAFRVSAGYVRCAKSETESEAARRRKCECGASMSRNAKACRRCSYRKKSEAMTLPKGIKP